MIFWEVYFFMRRKEYTDTRVGGVPLIWPKRNSETAARTCTCRLAVQMAHANGKSLDDIPAAAQNSWHAHFLLLLLLVESYLKDYPDRIKFGH